MRGLVIDARMTTAGGVWGMDLLDRDGDFHTASGWTASLDGSGAQIDPSLITADPDGNYVTLADTPGDQDPNATRGIARSTRPYRPPRLFAVEAWFRMTEAGASRTCYLTYAVDSLLSAQWSGNVDWTEWTRVTWSGPAALVPNGFGETVRVFAAPSLPAVQVRDVKAVAVY